MYRIINGLSPKHFMDKFSYISGGSRDGSNCNLYTNKSRSHKQFYYLGAKCWNILPQSLRKIEDVKLFTKTYKNQLLSSIVNNIDYKPDNKFDILYKIELD